MLRCASIHAIGDLIAGPMLAHKASAEGIAAAECIAGKPEEVNYDAIPSVIYTWPEVASVGLTKEQVKEREIDFCTGTIRSPVPDGHAVWVKPRVSSKSSPIKKPTASWA
jgi:pyruvate/2-oxoglutarate dehydrogenase complex dihydrolipoamide dehydrogenase (E3) component